MSAASVDERAYVVAFRGVRLRLRALHYGGRSSSGLRFLLVHGNPATADDFERLGPLLGELGEAVAPDLPGFGGSDELPPDTPGSALAAHADACRALLAELGWESNVTVVGHSHGGAVAQAFAARHAAAVTSVVLIGPLGHPAHLSYRLMSSPRAGAILAAASGALSERRLEWAKRALVALVGKVGFWPDRPEPAWLARFERFLERPDAVQWMATNAAEGPSDEQLREAAGIRSDVLLLHGASDRVIPLRFAKNLHAALVAAGVSCRLEVLPRSGHMLTHKNAQEVAERIERWCRETASA
jgi:pimeloyl-ACP methyl ester carboxylesterase